MRTKRSHWGVVTVTACAILLAAGCAPEPPKVDESLTVWDAKAIAQDMEDQIVALLPASDIDTVTQLSEGSLLGCSRDRGNQWSGGTEVQLKASPSPAELFAAIDRHFSEAEGYLITPRQDNGDELRDVEGPFNSIWVVRYDDRKREVRIVSGSPCFRLPDGVYPGGGW